MKLIDRYEARNPEDTEQIAKALITYLKPNDVVLLKGELGSGKTFLVKAICRLWHTDQPAVSPTFTIINQYSGTQPVNHIDLYRIEDPLELDNLGWEEVLYTGAVTFIEWPELIENRLDDFFEIKIDMQNDKRIFSFFKRSKQKSP